jgi:chromatin modification-related protein VID21
MRTDFREERKWKIVLAYDLSTAVLEWHQAGSREARRELGIIVDWNKPLQREVVEASGETGGGMGHAAMDIDGPSQGHSLVADDYASDDSDEDQENDRQEVVDVLAPSAALEDAFEQSQDTENTDRPASPTRTEFKTEDVEDALVLGDADDGSTPMEIDSQQPSTSGEASRKASPHEDPAASGLKVTSGDPNLAAGMEDKELPVPSRPPVKAKPNQYLTYRSEVAYSNELFFNLDALVQALEEPSEPAPDVTNLSSKLPPPSELTDIFPDLQPYNFFDIAPFSASEGRKKSEKRDRDDPSKRTDPTTYNKLTPMATFQRQRPTLLGPLKPSLHWQNGEWNNLDDAPVSVDFDGGPKPIDPINFGMYSLS